MAKRRKRSDKEEIDISSEDDDSTEPTPKRQRLNDSSIYTGVPYKDLSGSEYISSSSSSSHNESISSSLSTQLSPTHYYHTSTDSENDSENQQFHMMLRPRKSQQTKPRYNDFGDEVSSATSSESESEITNIEISEIQHEIQQFDFDVQSTPITYNKRQKLSLKRRKQRDRHEAYIYREKPRTISKGVRERIYENLLRPIWKGSKTKKNIFRMEIIENFNENQNKYKKCNIGKMNNKCPYCYALLFKNELTTTCEKGNWRLCCRNGDIAAAVELPPEPPVFLKHLLTGVSDKAKVFQKHIYKLNNALKFCTSRMQTKHIKGRGLQKFILSGKVVHWTKPLNLTEQNKQEFNEGEIYTFDPEEQFKKRINRSFLTEISNDAEATYILQTLQNIMIEENWIAKTYKNVYTQYFCPRLQLPNYIIAISMNINAGDDVHEKNYAFPTSNKLAAIYQTKDIYNSKPTHQQFILTNMNNVKTVINEESALSDPIAFPLFYPYGNYSYSGTMKKDYKITMRQYYRYQLMDRGDRIWNPFIHGKRLFEAWITTQLAKIQQQEMNVLKRIQPV